MCPLSSRSGSLGSRSCSLVRPLGSRYCWRRLANRSSPSLGIEHLKERHIIVKKNKIFFYVKLVCLCTRAPKTNESPGVTPPNTCSSAQQSLREEKEKERDAAKQEGGQEAEG